MRKAFTLLSLLLVVSIQAQRAQRNVDVGIMLGASNYNGELTQKTLQNFHFAGGLVGRYGLNNYFNLKGNVFYGTVSGADSTSDDRAIRDRNLSFKSFIFEFGAQLEWNILGYDATKTKKHGFSPFLFAGVAVYKYNPVALLDNEWIELQPLGTEGQGTTQFQERRKYRLTQVSFPVGAGFKLRVAKNWTLGVESGIRFTMNDYIDDVSKTYVEPGVLSAAYGQGSRSVRLADRSPASVQNERRYDPQTFVGPARGDVNKNDWYAYSGITITYTLFANRVKCFSF